MTEPTGSPYASSQAPTGSPYASSQAPTGSPYSSSQAPTGLPYTSSPAATGYASPPLAPLIRMKMAIIVQSVMCLLVPAIFVLVVGNRQQASTLLTWLPLTITLLSVAGVVLLGRRFPGAVPPETPDPVHRARFAFASSTFLISLVAVGPMMVSVALVGAGLNTSPMALVSGVVAAVLLMLFCYPSAWRLGIAERQCNAAGADSRLTSWT